MSISLKLSLFDYDHEKRKLETASAELSRQRMFVVGDRITIMGEELNVDFLCVGRHYDTLTALYFAQFVPVMETPESAKDIYVVIWEMKS
jgi:hypothetical protein